MLKKIAYLILLLFSFISFKTNAQITVDTNVTALKLAQKLVGTGVSISNAKLTAMSNQAGIFKSKNKVSSIGWCPHQPK